MSEPGEARVTINLNVTVPKFHEAWTGTPFPPSPMAAAVVLSQRIGLLSPEGRDTWWIVQERGPIQDVAAEMSDLIVRYGLPFLDSVSSLDSLLLHVGSCERPDGLEQNPKLVRAVMRHICGEEREARDLFTELVADKGHSADAAAIVAGRLGVETAS